MFIFGGKTSNNPLSTALIVKLSAKILGVDSDASNVSCSIRVDGLVSVGFEGALFNFGTSMDATVAALGATEEQEIEDAVTVSMSCGLNVSFISFKD